MSQKPGESASRAPWLPASHASPGSSGTWLRWRGETQARLRASVRPCAGSPRAAQRPFPGGAGTEAVGRCRLMLCRGPTPARALLKRSQGHLSGRENHQRHTDGHHPRPPGHQETGPHLCESETQTRHTKETEQDIERPRGRARSAKQMERERGRGAERRGRGETPRKGRVQRDETETGRTADTARAGRAAGGCARAPSAGRAHPGRLVTEVGAPAALAAFVLRPERLPVGRERPLPPREGRRQSARSVAPQVRPAAPERASTRRAGAKPRPRDGTAGAGGNLSRWVPHRHQNPTCDSVLIVWVLAALLGCTGRPRAAAQRGPPTPARRP